MIEQFGAADLNILVTQSQNSYDICIVKKIFFPYLQSYTWNSTHPFNFDPDPGSVQEKDPDPGFFLAVFGSNFAPWIRIHKAKILRIQRIRIQILSTAFKYCRCNLIQKSKNLTDSSIVSVT